ncbi:MAG TPA: amidohydrolase family protein, partial [Xanthobacteraceae bacterium]|nr:amidohydrolase family protein [Xanthobacteraceae bacterium]
MLTRIAGGRVIDPAHGRDGIGDIWMRDGHIVDAPPGGQADQTYDATAKIVMAGAIDIHSHIAGANTNTARLLLPEQHKSSTRRPAETPLSWAGWSTFETGCRYAEMGFTTVVEPAVSPHHALHAHLELADTPIIDKAILT